MVDLPAQLMFEVVDDRPCGTDCLGEIRATETVERFYFEVLAEDEPGVFRQESVVIVGEGMLHLGQLIALLITDENFRRGDSRELIKKSAQVRSLYYPELTRAQIGISKPET